MKKSFRTYLAGLVMAGALALPAQAQQNEEVKYNNGKILIEQQRYDQAMAELMPLTSAENLYAPEASYFYSLAAFKANKLQEAQLMLQQLKEEHPEWPNMPEAHYLLANVLFENSSYDRALAELQQITGSTSLSSDAEGLKRYYLNRLNDRTLFERLLQRYPNDKAVAQAYADKLIRGWYRPQDKVTLENIVSKFNLDRNRYLNSAAHNNSGFNIAVLLPFQLNQDLNQATRRNQFVTDLYAGMKLAQDSLSKQGIKVNLFSYDAGSDTTGVSRILAMPEVKQMDLVVGPIYKSAAPLAARFARTNNVPVINPLSQDLDVAKNNPQVYLFESSIATQARQAATFAFNNFTPKTAVIVYEAASSDTTFARLYRQHFIQLGGKVKTYRKIRSSDAAATAAAFNGLNLTDVGHLAVFSDKMTAAVNATSLAQAQSEKLPIVAHDKWLEINQLSLRRLSNLEVYYISPKYVNRMSPGATWFRKQYTSRYNLPPSVFAYAGFEMIYYYGTLLQQYGPDLNQAFAIAGIQPGVLFQGIGYTNASGRNEVRSDNQYVPITKLQEMQLIVVNPVYY